MFTLWKVPLFKISTLSDYKRLTFKIFCVIKMSYFRKHVKLLMEHPKWWGLRRLPHLPHSKSTYTDKYIHSDMIKTTIASVIRIHADSNNDRSIVIVTLVCSYIRLQFFGTFIDHLLPGFGGKLPREFFFKWCNLVRFREYFAKLLSKK